MNAQELTSDELYELREVLERMENKEPGLYRRYIGDRLLVIDYDSIPALSPALIDVKSDRWKLLDTRGSVSLYVLKDLWFEEDQ